MTRTTTTSNSTYVSIIKRENPGFKGYVPLQKPKCDGRGNCLDTMFHSRSKREQKKIMKSYPVTCRTKCLFIYFIVLS